jgi:hypothetical protein
VHGLAGELWALGCIGSEHGLRVANEFHSILLHTGARWTFTMRFKTMELADVYERGIGLVIILTTVSPNYPTPDIAYHGLSCSLAASGFYHLAVALSVMVLYY